MRVTAHLYDRDGSTKELGEADLSTKVTPVTVMLAAKDREGVIKGWHAVVVPEWLQNEFDYFDRTLELRVTVRTIGKDNVDA